MKFHLHFATLTIASTLLIGCSTQSRIDEQAITPDVPETWQQINVQSQTDLEWLNQFNNKELTDLIEQAISLNRNLKQQAYTVAIQEQATTSSEADLWPTIDFGLSSSRRASGEPTQYSNENDLSLDVSYELDVWGKLSDAAQQDHLTYLASKATYQQSKNQLVADVITQYYELVSGQQLTQLFEKRVALAEENLDIIASGYKQGLNEALDVYLSRNELNAERASLASQKARVQQLSAALEQLIGQYPAGTLFANQSIPVMLDNIETGVPSAIIKNKPELQASWYQLMAQDAALAFAHKQRFPSIRLSGSYGSKDSEIENLLSSSTLGWSLLGSISAPIFNAGKLKSAEQQQALRLKQQEQIYLDSLYLAFAQVEQGITQEQSFKEQYHNNLAAQENALIAQNLAFEQYQSGLVSYTTVLDAQERAFNAQSNVITLKSQMITNRINLYVALGGDFSDKLIKPELSHETE